MSKNLLVDYIPFEISREKINESMSKNNGRLIVKGVLQRAEAKNQNGRVYPKETLMREAEKFFMLQQLDTLWREHLQSMDSLRESVGLRGYGQKDPLIEYKNEGYDMFLEMMINMRRNVIYSMFMFQPAPPSDKD